MTPRSNRLILMTCLAALGCGPQAIEPETAPPTGIFQTTTPPPADGVHKFLVHDVLEGDKYWFLESQEMDGTKYWVATAPGNFQPGGTYQFSGGLFKTGYRSEEFDRTFDALYLVAAVTPLGVPAAPAMTQATPVEPAEGATPIAQVVAEAAQRAGQRVRVTGRVTKVNPDIMNRHWIHLQDGSRDDFDFVVTSDQIVPVGHTVTVEGTLSVDRDFGAGYRYDVILENGQWIR